MPYIDGHWVSRDEDSAFLENRVKAEIKNPGWVSNTGDRFKSVAVTEPILPPGVYRFVNTDDGLFFEKQSFPSDAVVSLPGLPSDFILDQIKLFWKRRDEYKKFGFIHKRGILLYGPPGCGKTSIIRLLSDEVLKLGGIVFSIDDFKLAAGAISNFRLIEPNRPILTLQEDIEGLFNGNEGAHQIKAALSFLDGQDQCNNIVHVATTNQPEELADRFIKRPGRFDLVIGLKAPTAQTREAYIRYTCGDKISDEVLKELVEKTKDLELAYLREIASTYLCLGVPIEESVKRLQANSKVKYLKNKDKSKMGFVIGYEESRDDS